MDHIVRKVTSSLLLALLVISSRSPVRCEPPLSNQYGVPGNFASSQGAQGYAPSQQQSLTNSYGLPLGDNGAGNAGNGGGYGGNGGGNGGGHGGGGGHDEQDYIDSQPKSYEFGYEVSDAASGNNYGRRESSDGETVRGEYRVQLPDGRTQIVTYTADWRTGFHADVRYEGVAQYPDQYGTNNGGASNNNNNNNNNNQGYAPPANNQINNGYDYSGPGNSGNVDSGYQSNQGGYNSYQGGSNNGYQGSNNNNYNSNQNNNGGYNNNNNNNYQFGSNSIDNGYGGGPSLAPPIPQPPQTAYGVPFH